MIDRFLGDEIDSPEDEERDDRLDRDIRPEHLHESGSADDPREGDNGEEQTVHGYRNGIGDEDPAPLRPIFTYPGSPEMVDIRISKLGYECSYDRAEDDSELERE